MFLHLSVLTLADASQCIVNRGAASCGMLLPTSVGTSSTGDMSDYGAYGSGLSLPQDVWEFTCTSDTTVTVTLAGLQCDVDLFLLPESCNTVDAVDASRRFGTSDEEVTFDCSPGASYAFVVERIDAGTNPFATCNNFTSLDYTLAVACPEICDNGVDDDGDGSADCADPDCQPCGETCDNALDDDFDGLFDCDDPDCAGTPACCDADGDGAFAKGSCGGNDCDDDPLSGGASVFPGAPEISGNGIDEDCDGSDRTLHITALAPGVAGVVNDVRIAGASTSGEVFVGVSLQPGATPLPGCGIASGLQRPLLYGTGVADIDGELQVPRLVPGSLSSRRVWLQAFEPATCALSEPVPVDL
jgi:hypothetical protein